MIVNWTTIQLRPNDLDIYANIVHLNNEHIQYLLVNYNMQF